MVWADGACPATRGVSKKREWVPCRDRPSGAQLVLANTGTARSKAGLAFNSRSKILGAYNIPLVLNWNTPQLGPGPLFPDDGSSAPGDGLRRKQLNDAITGKSTFPRMVYMKLPVL